MTLNCDYIKRDGEYCHLRDFIIKYPVSIPLSLFLILYLNLIETVLWKCLVAYRQYLNLTEKSVILQIIFN